MTVPFILNFYHLSSHITIHVILHKALIINALYLIDYQRVMHMWIINRIIICLLKKFVVYLQKGLFLNKGDSIPTHIKNI
jgi:hypothetical protein